MHAPRTAFSLLLLAILSILASASRAAQPAPSPALSFDQTPPAGAALIASQSAIAQLYIDADDPQPTAIATGLLAQDLQKVTGKTPKILNDPAQLSADAILIGTLGHSALIDRLAAGGKLNTADLRNQWEAYTIQIVDKPLPNVPRALVIAGSDRRGTAYGVLTLSEAIGVSPWYYWADVPIAKHEAIAFLPGGGGTERPFVRYRGIFLNDEAPALTGWATEKFGGYNHTFYVHVFELLLRLKANYLWPAMWNNCFNEDDPLNPKLANDWGIVMGTSHVEPLMRADKEWNRKGYSAAQWNYDKSPKELIAFWKEGLERNKPYDNLITIAMRGKIDTPMSESANVALLERIVTDQRKLIAEVINPDVTRVPQLWALYKEVQEYYEKGMRVPDDVTLLWCDDNWGNIRRLPTPEERNRSGGAGIYYHFDYVGDPRNYKWLNTNPLPRIWEQMNLAYNYGADRIWIVNVGDLKPMEFPIDFFMSMAWNPPRMTLDRLNAFGPDWAARQFGPAHAKDIADILAKYAKYNGRRKPELLEPATFSLVNFQEADRVLADWQALTKQAEDLYNQLSPESRDAFYQLVLHPTKASAVVNELYITAARNRLYAAQGRAATNDLAARARELFQADAQLAADFNHTLAGGKWNHMMDQTHIGYTNWQQPAQNNMPQVKEIDLPATPQLALSPEGSTSVWPGTSSPALLPAFDVFNNPRRHIDLFNRGKGTVSFTATADAPWIILSQTQGSFEKEVRVEVTIDWTKTPSNSTKLTTGIITITPPESPPITIDVHAFKPSSPTPESLQGFVETPLAEGSGYVSIEAEHFTAQHAAGPVHFDIIPDLGRTLSAVTPFPVTSPSLTAPNAPCLEYKIYFFTPGPVNVEAILSPTLNFQPGRGLRYALSFDDQPPQIIDSLAKNTPNDWRESVKDAVRKSRSNLNLQQPGYHTLKFWMVDPGIVLQRLVLDRGGGGGGLPPTYLGPPETFHRIP